MIAVEEDEVLLAIAENLAKFRAYMKDDKFIATFPLYQTLLCAEETVVRETTIESMREIVKSLSDDLIVSHVIPIIYNISGQENFTGRVSAVYMIRMVYQKAGKEKEKLRTVYFKLCDEDLPLIKRAAAKEFGSLCKVMEKEVVNPDMINYFKKFMNESDSIRVLLLNSLVDLVKLFNNTELQRINIQVVVAASDDKSWRVRHELARIFPELIDGFGSQINELVPTFSNLIKDGETEVKIAALEGLNKVIENINSEKVSICIIPSILMLSGEGSPHVKALIGESLGPIAKHVGYSTFSSKLNNMFEALLKDTNSDVRLGVAKSLYDIFITSDQALLKSISTTIGGLLKDTQYKIREQVYITLAKLGAAYGLDTFKAHIEPLYFGFLTDTVSAVRDRGVETLDIINSKFGQTWVANTLIPKLMTGLSQQKTSYLHRVTIISSVAQCAKNLNPTNINDAVIPNLLKCVKDKIPNVRFYLVKKLGMVLEYADSTGKDKIKS